MGLTKKVRFTVVRNTSKKTAHNTVQNAVNKKAIIGIVLFISAMLFINLLDVLAKHLSAEYPALQITWARFAFHLLLLIPLLSLKRQAWWKIPPAPKSQTVRSLFLLMANLFFFIALASTPIPNAIALVFIAPLIVTVVSPFMLGERFKKERLGAVIAGFIGVLVVLQPATSSFQIGSLFALASGVSLAFYFMITRKLSRDNQESAAAVTPLLALFYTAVVGAVVMSFMMPAVWVMPDLQGWGLFALMGLVAAVGHYLIIRAFDYASASLLAPLNYTEIVGGTLLSYVFFDYLPSPAVWLGMSIIVLSGVYSSLAEFRGSGKDSKKVTPKVKVVRKPIRTVTN